MTKSNVNSHDDSSEFLAAGEPEFNKKEKTKAEVFADKLVDGFHSRLDEKLEDLDLDIESFNSDVENGFQSLDDLQSQFDSIMEQSNSHSNRISETIKVTDLSEETVEILLGSVDTMTRLSSERSLTEKAISIVPHAGIRKKLEKGFKLAKVEKARNQSVREYAEAHFKKLNAQKDTVNDNRSAVDEISRQLNESSTILHGMLSQTHKKLVSVTSSGGSKSDEIRSKELMVRIGEQIKSQNEIVEQAVMFETLAAIVSEKIAATLPRIRNQFINQVSVTASLNNLVHWQESIEKTDTMVLKMKNDVFTQANNVLDKYKKTGFGETDEQAQLAKSAEIKLESIRTKNKEISRINAERIEREFKKMDQSLLK